MNIADALKHSSVAVHRKSGAMVEAFRDLNFSLLTINHVTFVIQDLPNEGSTAINGVDHDRDEARAFAIKLKKETGISFEHGWSPCVEEQQSFTVLCLTFLIIACHIVYDRVFGDGPAVRV